MERRAAGILGMDLIAQLSDRKVDAWRSQTGRARLATR